MVVSRIADRLLPPELTEEEETKAGDSDDEDDDVNDSQDMDVEWLLRFDGACRANPGPGGAALFCSSPAAP